MPFPSSGHITPAIKDTLNLQAILAAPVTTTLPLMDFLKVKPEMWAQVSRLLRSKGFEIGDDVKSITQLSDSTGLVRKVPLNKVNKYEQPNRDKGNAMLPIKMGKVKTFAILDTGAGISIATKAMWIKWGQRALRKTRMDLQLANGNLEHPLGLLENVVVESCGVQYEHTFAIVDFVQDPNYEIILGRSFMQQLKIIQD